MPKSKRDAEGSIHGMVNGVDFSEASQSRGFLGDVFQTIFFGPHL